MCMNCQVHHAQTIYRRTGSAYNGPLVSDARNRTFYDYKRQLMNVQTPGTLKYKNQKEFAFYLDRTFPRNPQVIGIRCYLCMIHGYENIAVRSLQRV